MIYLFIQNAKQILAATTANDDFEYGESWYKEARWITRKNDKRIAINGLGRLPRGFKHVKDEHQPPKTMNEWNWYYFYTMKRNHASDDTYVPFDKIGN